MKDELYHEAILALAKQATGRGRLEAPHASVTVDNPLCGDRVTLDLSVDDGRVSALGHQVRGCLLCQAAAAAIGARAPGETPVALRALAQQLRQSISQGLGGDGLWPELSAFAPVHPHKSRHDCVLLPFDALTQALEQAQSR